MKKLLSIAFAFALAVNFSSAQVQVVRQNFSSGSDDFGPSLTQNNRILYFTSDREGGQRLFMVERKSNGWTEPVMTPVEQLGEAKHIGASTLSTDGQTLVFSAYNHDLPGSGRTDLFYAEKSGGKWTNITNLGPTVNSKAWDAQPSLSADGSVLYFASDREGGFGGADIYMCKRQSFGWSAPVNLGPGINGPNDDLAPCIAPDNKTLFFSSNKPGGAGGFDIYLSTVNGDAHSNIRLASAPINSVFDEYYYTVIPNTDIAFFSSNREGSSEIDVYSAIPNPYPSDPVLLIQGTVRDAVTRQPLGSNITITDLKSNKKIAEFKSDDVTGEYFVSLPAGRPYSLTASKKGYVFHSERFELPEHSKDNAVTKDIDLSPLAQGNTRLLVFFDYDKSELKDESRPDLDRTVEFLRDNPDIKIALEGHTDDVGPDKYNIDLSQRRVDAVKQYIVSAGVNTSRIATKGFGKSKPLVQGTSDEARAQNRRVEMKIAR